MPGLVIVDAAESRLLTRALVANFTLRLCRNNPTTGLTAAEIDALAAGAFTEANFAGYAPADLDSGTWTVTQGNPTTAVNAKKSFTRSSTGTAQLIHGYYVTDDADGALQWFELFPGPVSVEFLNDQVDVTPKVTLDDRSGNVTVPIGGSILWSGPANAVPSGFLLRDGSAVSRTTYALLFAELGTTYGAGDGSTTFNLPNQKGRFPVGVADAGTASARGQTGGSIDHVHGLDTATSHARVSIASGTTDNIWIQRKSATSWNATIEGNLGGAGGDTDATATGSALGGDSATANPPFLADYFIIRAT